MKKLYLSITLLGMFFLMFVITLIPIQASSYQGITLDTTISTLGNNSLRDVFELGNLVDNHEFNDGLNHWNLVGLVTAVVNDGILELTASQYNYIEQSIGNNGDFTNDHIYSIVNYQTQGTNWRLGINQTNEGYQLLPQSNLFRTQSIRNIGQSGSSVVLAIDFSTSLTELYIDYVYVVNLSYWGIDNLTNTEIDYYFTIYQALKNGLNIDLFYNQGEYDGYDAGYDSGYDAGLIVGENTGYNSGYSVGFNEGRDDAIDNNFTLIGLIELLVGVVLSMVGWIINIEIFNISIIGILSTLAVGIGIIWLLKLIRG